MHIPHTPMQYAPTFHSLVRVFDFQEFVDLYLICNASAASPFHNFRYAQWAVEDTYRYYVSALEVDRVFDKPVDDIRITLIGALFKDCNHGCGACDDETNVMNALLSLQDANEMAQRPLTRIERQTANALISSTLFMTEGGRASYPKAPTTLGEQALRDAELSIVFHAFSEVGKLQYEGFLQELNFAASLAGRPKFSMRDLAAETSRFLMQDARFFTPLGMATRDRHLQKCLDELTAYAENSRVERLRKYVRAWRDHQDPHYVDFYSEIRHGLDM